MNITQKILFAVNKIILKFIKVNDPWEMFQSKIPLRVFGPGAIHDFSWYFKGISNVKVDKMEDIVEWLSGCTYEDDYHIFREIDNWQHPSLFEKIRKGDCEDHALWAWRKLIELGIESYFVCGYLKNEDIIDYSKRHAWVQFNLRGTEYLMETTEKDKKKAISFLNQAKEKYIPEFAVNPNFQKYIYMGFLKAQQDRIKVKKK
ncbi:MAG: hypothetical protein A2161_10635 [Candidatus Schekmanbacteria bacterium RBG_13_48_7]|uniref:Transglutaminase-like domain-containing protein n=1 Tax=Candidatus Schekmanbacteria bacterium RBG_13_48_7 TaxID=1817878 RepID=A0A1F7RUQ8_9BACT|nr:MAG: hypothetical protein A2161_10635 [Candidatus Schekmanbacteria bacterium RBG_13_48_7]